jgi:rod shape-determining protein MreC
VSKVFSGQKNILYLICFLTVSLFFSSNPTAFLKVKVSVIKVFAFPSSLLRGVGDFFVAKSEILEKNKSLEKQLADIFLEKVQIDEMKIENNRLRSLLELKEKIEYDTIAAEIISREPNDLAGAFIINRGKSDGLKTKSAVCSQNGFLGKVVEITGDTAYVVLLTNPNFKAGGIIKENRVNGVVVGTGDGFARMLYIPMDVEVEEGYTVQTSGLSRTCPPGIQIGKIKTVNKSPTGLYQYAVIEPFAKCYVEEEVLCVINNENNEK